MTNSNATTDSEVKPSPRIWSLALTAVGLPVVFGLYQVFIYFNESFPHLYWKRTLPALTAVVLAIAGIVAPIWVIIKRKQFCHWTRLRQWQVCAALLLGMSLLYLAPFVMLVDAARHSRAIIPYTPNVVLHTPTDRAGAPFHWGVGGGPGTGHGSSHSHGDSYETEWNGWLEPEGLDHGPGPDPIVRLRAEGDTEKKGNIRIRIENGRTVRFYTSGFRDETATQNDESVTLPITLDPGTHEFVIHPGS